MKRPDVVPAPIWHLLTGEYPPQVGGVGDYTAGLAAPWLRRRRGPRLGTSRSRTDSGDHGRDRPPDRRVLVLPPTWVASARRSTPFAPPRRLLVQHVPNAWGYKGLNLGFGRWLLGAAPAGGRTSA